VCGQALDALDLSGCVYMVTGANSGIGFCLSNFLAARGATCYLVCRNEERAKLASESIMRETGSTKVRTIIADCGLRSGVLKAIEELSARESRLDCLVCNAGALLGERTVTAEGHEVTFATHLLFGSYFLTRLALPLLRRSPEPRVLFVSSGGMYNAAFPRWTVATATDPDVRYDGQMAYAYAKRGQVLLAERLDAELPDVKCLSCHPGWTETPGIEAAYGGAKRLFEPLRTLWQGTEGIAWLATARRDLLEGGAFYLDRSPCTKHMAGPFFSQGSFTQNSADEVDAMMKMLAANAPMPPT